MREMTGMLNKSWVAQKPKTAVTAAAIAALMIGGTGLALAGSDPSQSNGTQIAAATAVQTQPANPALTGFADIVDGVLPAVVSIEVEHDGAARPATAEQHGQVMPFNDFMERFFNQRGEGPNMGQGGPSGEDFQRWYREYQNQQGGRQEGPAEAPMRAAGAGFIINADGTIVTNNHVVAEADRINVTLSDGHSYEATLVGRDPATDLAVIKIEADKPLPYVPFGDSDQARVGDWVITIGNPFGLENSVTTGIISARDRSIGAGRYDDFLQIDAPINHGNSGGPAFNTKGEVIGVNTAIFSPSGGSVGIGFAIPSDMVQEIVAELKSNGRVERGWLGVNIQQVTDDMAEGLNLDKAHGAIVAEVTKDSPAMAAGLTAGDVIVSVNDTQIDGVRDLTRTIARLDPGQDAELGVWRKGELSKVTVQLGSFPEPQQMAEREAEQPQADKAVMGMRLAELDERTRQAYGIAEETKGVVITGVDPDSWAARRGLRSGDVIVQAGLSTVTSPSEVAAAVESAKQEHRKAVLVLISREQEERFVTLPLRDV
jgi:serine protease Do